MFSVKESLPMLILFAISSGVLLTFATAATNYPAFIEKQYKESIENEQEKAPEDESLESHDDDKLPPKPTPAASASSKEIPKSRWAVAYFVNLICAMFGGIATLVGTWFGPLSIFGPVKQVSQITSGLIMFSYILQTEKKPSKDTMVGNYIIMISAILLIFVGAEVRDESISGNDLWDKRASQIWGGVFLTIALVFTFPYQFILGCWKPDFLTDNINFACLLATEVSHAVVGTSCAKFVPTLEGKLFVANIILLVLTTFTIAYSSVLRSVVVSSQTSYVPLMLGLTSILNGVTGVIVWEEKIINQGGYVCVALFFVLGVYLISDYDILPGKEITDDRISIGGVRPILKSMMNQSVIRSYSERNLTADNNLSDSTLPAKVDVLLTVAEESDEDDEEKCAKQANE